MRKVWLINLITFISAFLLFQIELIIAKIFLPNYGGSYLVWGSCIVFFQAVLLLGYLFSHFVISRFGIARYRWVHLAALFLPLLFFPGKPLNVGSATSTLSLGIDVFLRLAITIGPVFFILSTISLITQAYLSKSSLPEKDNPYALYSVSNFGSFAALLSYPFVFEYMFTLSQQLFIWRGFYFCLMGLHILAFCVIGVSHDEKKQVEGKLNIKNTDIRRWLLLGAAGTVMFLSVNNIITIKIAPLPLLWILPLCIYLLAFVLNFKRTCWCPAWINEKIHIILGFSIVLYFLIHQGIFPVLIEAILLMVVLFVLCMYCQNQLITTKPKNEQDLTAFYVYISLGSFVGGIVTTWVIPLISTELIEYVIGLIIVAATMIPKGKGSQKTVYYIRLVVFLMILLTIWPIVFYKYNVWALLILFFIIKSVYCELAQKKYFILISLVCILGVIPYSEMFWKGEINVFKKRNYYGLLRVSDHQGSRFLFHGTTVHGMQYLDPKKKLKPTMYYDGGSPVAEILTTDTFDFQRIGIVGLGVGIITMYTTANQIVDFYELDPDIYTVADQYFTYIHNSPSELNYIYGDARLSLNENINQKYDLLVVDAFGGDAIPVHLLTEEMIAKYKNHLTDRGVLLFHISNRYVLLGPILSRIGYALNAQTFHKIGRNLETPEVVSTWVVMTWNGEEYKQYFKDTHWNWPRYEHIMKLRPWTDEYSSVLPFIKVDSLISSIKNFNPLSW